MKKWFFICIWGIAFSLLYTRAMAQTDSLILKNNDIIVGEIKSMDKGILTIETSYSKNDFTIEWKDIRQVYTTSRFLITLRSGSHHNSTLRSDTSMQIQIKGDNEENFKVGFPDIVYLKELESDFWSRVSGNVDVGLNLTKANNLRQLNIQTALGYLTDDWGVDMYYNDYRSSQDSIANSIRKEGGANYRYFLEEDWYIIPQLSYLSNTEQALKSRLTANLGAGRFLSRNNSFYWGIIAGFSLNAEDFTNETEGKRSAEIYTGTEINLFDFGDLDFLSNLMLYPSLTEKGRFRSDFKLDSKFEFAEDFYIKLNLTFNYDNQPAIQGNETDYVFGVSFGWELN